MLFRGKLDIQRYHCGWLLALCHTAIFVILFCTGKMALQQWMTGCNEVEIRIRPQFRLYSTHSLCQLAFRLYQVDFGKEMIRV